MTPAQLRHELLLACVLAAALLLLLNGCASEGWQEHPVRAPLPGVLIASTATEIQAKCPKVPGARGCAELDYDHGICLVYAPADAPVWLLAHEALHCMGYRHD